MSTARTKKVAQGGRNLAMTTAIEVARVQYPFSFVVAGDSGYAPDPEAERRFERLVDHVEKRPRKPVFFASLGDFAGPGTRERHERYLAVARRLSMPNICALGNHEVENGNQVHFEEIHGPPNYRFACGPASFTVLNCHQWNSPPGLSPDTLAFLDDSLRADSHPVRIVLMHEPPDLQGHYVKPTWQDLAFTESEAKFLRILRTYKVALVCCAHILRYDHVVHEGIHFVVSGGGGGDLCLSQGAPYSGLAPRDQLFYHFVEITVAGPDAISGAAIPLDAELGTTAAAFRF